MDQVDAVVIGAGVVGLAVARALALAGHEVKDHSAGAGIIGGVGVISGVECVVTASDATQKGGAVSELGVQKSNRLGQIAEQNRLPSVSLIESAGADLPNQSKIFV